MVSYGLLSEQELTDRMVSMGPRPEGHGKRVLSEIDDIVSVGFQWGHDPKVMVSDKH